MKILIVEDDSTIRRSLQMALESRDNIVDSASDGEEGIHKARTYYFDMIIMDNVMPIYNGTEVSSLLRKNNIMTPVIMLSQQDDINTKIVAFKNGIDDYLTKPFSFEELCARIDAIKRRPIQIQSSTHTIGELVVDEQKRQVLYRKIKINLSRKEYALLLYLTKHKGHIINRMQLIDRIWDNEIDAFSNTIEVHIRSLRKKLRDTKRTLIKTIPGLGYSISD